MEREVPRPSRPDPVGETLDTVASIRKLAAEDLNLHQRWIERVIEQTGRPRALYVTLLVVAAWCLYNLAAHFLHWPVFDEPPFFWLQGVLGVYATLLAIAVLARQNRQERHDAHRDHLELQVNLLAEQKVAKIIALLEELRADLPNVRHRVDKEADAMTDTIDAEEALEALEEVDDADGAGATRDTRARRRGAGSRRPSSSPPR